MFIRPQARAGRLVAAGFSALLLTACSGLSQSIPDMSEVGGLVTPYKIDILQGNVITREQVAMLETGMARGQVQGILGTPLLTSVFHSNRWDYVFTLKRQGQEAQSRKLTVFFKDDVLERFDADEMPSENEFVSSLNKSRRSGDAPDLQATPEQLEAFANKNPRSSAGNDEDAARPSRTYPPLESGNGAN
ncbi:hypothetical protein NBRC116584_35940 [Hydrogenophaga sp. 5NK40-0174]